MGGAESKDPVKGASDVVGYSPGSFDFILVA